MDYVYCFSYLIVYPLIMCIFSLSDFISTYYVYFFLYMISIILIVCIVFPI